MTNEYYHQTATATFLVTPQRTKVILAKLGTAVLAGGVLLDPHHRDQRRRRARFSSAVKGYDSQLGEWPVTRAILMNGLAYGLWGVLGVGLGVLIRNQIGAVVTGTAAYFLGFPVALLATGALYKIIQEDWVTQTLVAWPAVAAEVMTSRTSCIRTSRSGGWPR